MTPVYYYPVAGKLIPAVVTEELRENVLGPACFYLVDVRTLLIIALNLVTSLTAVIIFKVGFVCSKD